MKQRDVLQDEWQDALKLQGCALCRISAQGTARALKHVLNDTVNEPGMREEIRASLGYCNRHAWQLRELRGIALSIALLYRDALLELEAQLESLPAPDPRARMDKLRTQAARAAAPRADCPACEIQSEIEARYTGSLLNLVADPAFVEILHASDGLCRLHLQRSLVDAPNSAVFTTLLECQRAIQQRLLADLHEFIRKSDYRFKDEGWGREGDAWIRAIELLSSPSNSQSSR